MKADPVHVSNIAERCNVSNDAVHKWIDRHSDRSDHPFPEPRWRTGGVRTWEGTKVFDWLQATGRNVYAVAWLAWVNEHGTGY